jgi:hypothetical protein
MNDDPLSPEEQARLASARVPVMPPDGQEDRIVAALQERGLLRPRRRLGVLVLAAAAAIVVAVAWAFVPRTDPVVAPAGPRYVLMLYGGSDPAQGAAGNGSTRRREYSEWARGIASQGVAITGEELADESRALGAALPSVAGAVPRGFFVVSAPDLDAAQQIASTCPHLRYGGRIVIQRIL